MALGIAGDSGVTDGANTQQLILVELRVISGLMQADMGGEQANEPLPLLRNDEAAALFITPLPVPGIS